MLKLSKDIIWLYSKNCLYHLEVHLKYTILQSYKELRIKILVLIPLFPNRTMMVISIFFSILPI